MRRTDLILELLGHASVLLFHGELFWLRRRSGRGRRGLGSRVEILVVLAACWCARQRQPAEAPGTHLDQKLQSSSQRMGPGPQGSWLPSTQQAFPHTYTVRTRDGRRGLPHGKLEQSVDGAVHVASGVAQRHIDHTLNSHKPPQKKGG